MAAVETSMHFLRRDELYNSEKPYQLKYAAAEGVPISNFRLEKKEPIKINSLRGCEKEFSFDKNGFTVMKIDEDIPYNDFSDGAGIRRYLDVVAAGLQNLLGADKVQVYQYVVRPGPRRPSVEDMTLTILRFVNVIQPFQSRKKVKGTSSASHRQSLILVCIHCSDASKLPAQRERVRLIQSQDTTREQAMFTFQEVNGDAATLSPNLRYQVVNVWKPLRGPLRDWPLALCDAASVQTDQLVAADAVFKSKVTENLQVHYDAGHRWYYLEDQKPSELLVFRQADSHPAGRVGVPHTSFLNPKASGDEQPRESIEVRALVSYGSVD
ncbi:MAG: hypothetical protein Q9200_001728 [Gallowayella weberi]